MSMHPESAVKDRYSEAAQSLQSELCCPVSYNPAYLKIIPDEVLERDYGCGDPSAHLREGETVLDLGSGGGKICFIAGQVVGPTGRVIGVDMNPEMLALARAALPKTGLDNIEFLEGRIQDLRSNPAETARYLAQHPVKTAQDALALQRHLDAHPLVADDSVDTVVSNCVLNLVAGEHKSALFREMFRVIRRGGRAVISDIVCDEAVPQHLRENPELWSGCVSGALREDAFLRAFTDAGFYGVRILKRDDEPWRTVEGIEFRSLTVEAFKGKEGPCWEGLQAVVYRGPFAAVIDDDGHCIPRGVRYAVCKKTFGLYGREPYRDQFFFVEPLHPVEHDETPFDCKQDAIRDPRATKGADYDVTTDAAVCCEPTDGDAPCC